MRICNSIKERMQGKREGHCGNFTSSREMYLHGIKWSVENIAQILFYFLIGIRQIIKEFVFFFFLSQNDQMGVCCEHCALHMGALSSPKW